MHSPLSTQAFAQLRDACGPSPVRRMSMIPLMTVRGSPLTSPGPVTGQTSTHLPQRVQASAMASTRAERAVSKVTVMRSLAHGYRAAGGWAQAASSVAVQKSALFLQRVRDADF